jgi:hypothetical protein
MEADGSIVLEGRCPVEEAEPLVRLLSQDPRAAVDWRGCEDAHAAVVQVLLAARPTMIGPPVSWFLRDWVEPLLRPGGENEDRRIDPP